MNKQDYLTQVLIVIAKGCKPNSPIDGRDYFNLKPRGGKIPGLGEARDALTRAGLIESASRGIWVVKPTNLGYELVEQWKQKEQTRRARPVLYAPVEVAT